MISIQNIKSIKSSNLKLIHVMKNYFHLMILLCLFSIGKTYAQENPETDINTLISELSAAVNAQSYDLALDISQQIRAQIKGQFCSGIAGDVMPNNLGGYTMSETAKTQVNRAPNKTDVTLKRVYYKKQGQDSTAFNLLITNSAQHMGGLSQMFAKGEPYTDGNYRIVPQRVQNYRAVFIKDQKLLFKSVAILAGSSIVRFDFPPDMDNASIKSIVEAFDLNSIIQKFGN